MKKTTSLIIAFLFVITSFSQKNLFENLSPFEGQEFKVFHIKYNYVDERFYIKESDYEKNVIINAARNGANKPVGLNFLDAASKSEKDLISYSAHHSKVDHYSQPAYAYTDLKGKETYLMIDDILYAIDYANEDMSKYGDRSGYGLAYVPMSVLNKKTDKTEDKTEKKKVSFKDKFKNLMETQIGAAPLPEALKQIKSREDFEAKINNYLTEMRKKQAANPYTALDKKEMAAMDKEAADIKAGIKKTNSDYWKSDAGQAVLARENKTNMKVYNSTNNTIWLVNEDGNTAFVKAGLTFDIKCSKRWYYSVGQDNTKGEFIGGGSDSYCSKKITL